MFKFDDGSCFKTMHNSPSRILMNKICAEASSNYSADYEILYTHTFLGLPFQVVVVAVLVVAVVAVVVVIRRIGNIRNGFFLSRV